MSRETYIQGLSWASVKRVDPVPAHQNLMVYTEALTRLNHLTPTKGSQQHSALSRFCLWDSSHCGKSGQNIYSKGRGGCEELLIARVQLAGGHVLSTPPSSHLENQDNAITSQRSLL